MLNDWYALGAVQYRKWHIYDMNWTAAAAAGGNETTQETPINLENYLVCGAPFGGPVAMIPDNRRSNSTSNLQQPSGNDSFKNKLLIFTSSGMPLAEIDWQDRPVMGMGWTDHENLVVIADNGKAFSFHVKLLSWMYLFCLSIFKALERCMIYRAASSLIFSYWI